MNPPEAPRNVAFNVRRLRRQRGWTQGQAAEAMRTLGGPLWSKAVWSAMERSIDGGRVRAFSAEDVAWLALTFGVPVGDLFGPAPEACAHCGGTGHTGGAA